MSRTPFPTSVLKRIPQGLFLLALGLAPLSLEVRWWKSLAANVYWTSVPGTIELDQEGNPRYAYQYGGVTYRSSTFHFGGDGGGPGAQQKGEAVTVYVNPLDPDDAVLDRSLNLNPASLGFDLLFLFLFGLTGCQFLWRSFRLLWHYHRSRH